ncbi:MAG: polysaccharide biosynthesis/export family protein [Bacteroidia bacterium]|nr:polysaccharide biosynthesis/export family protein [Bacteroidia bacterium]
MNKFRFLILIFAIAALTGCKSYTANIILKTNESDINWKSEYQKTVVAYTLKTGDLIQFSLYTNLGEAIIDPNGKLAAPNSGDNNTLSTEKPTFLVLENGICYFPVIGKVQVVGLTITQMDSVISKKFEAYYNEVYTISNVINKRIIILGGTKGGMLIPFTNSSMTLLEALALYGGLDANSKGYNIRIVRGDLKTPEVTVVNLKTISDMKATIVNLKPDDIVYIEPVRRPGTEGIRDNLYILNILQVLLTFTFLINSLK